MDFKAPKEENIQSEAQGTKSANSANKLVMSLLGVMVVFLLVIGAMIFKGIRGSSLKTNIVEDKQETKQEQVVDPEKQTPEEVKPLSQEEIDDLLNNPAVGGEVDPQGAASPEEVAPLSQEEIDALLSNPPVADPSGEAATQQDPGAPTQDEQAAPAPTEEVAPLSQEEIDALLNNPAVQ